MKRLRHHRPSPAMIVALIALFVALGGSSYSAIKIGAGNLKRGAVGTRALADNSIRSTDLRNNDATGKDVKDDSLNNSDIDNRTLHASSADSASSATNAGTLDGIDSTSFTRGDCGVANGAIHGYARIVGPVGATFSTANIEFPYNCSGQSVEARSQANGFTEVRFNGNPASIAVATPMQAPSVSPSEMNVSLSRTGLGSFMAVTSIDGGPDTNWPFTIIVM